jgi:hypothetical protein
MFDVATIWDQAIVRNLGKLKVILEPLLAMLSVYEGVGAVQMPRSIHRNIMGVLRPAESALRRLIVMAARDLVVDDAAKPLPKRAPRKSKRSPPKTFQLFDPRKRFRPHRVTYSKHTHRIYVIEPDPPFIPPFLRGPRPEIGAPEAPVKRISAASVTRRLHAFAAALENLPAQAQRMAKLRHRRAQKRNFKSPLRIGKPPGHQNTAKRPIDQILAECHSYASAVLSQAEPNTS